jgi:hypothetical protein
MGYFVNACLIGAIPSLLELGTGIQQAGWSHGRVIVTNVTHFN